MTPAPPAPLVITLPPDGAPTATPVFVSQGEFRAGARLLSGVRVQTWAYYQRTLVHNTITTLSDPLPGLGAITFNYRWAGASSNETIEWVIWLDENNVPRYKIFISGGSSNENEAVFVDNQNQPIEGILP